MGIKDTGIKGVSLKGHETKAKKVRGALKDGGTKNKHGFKSEARLSKKMGFRQTPASGAMEGAKSDGKSRDFRIECKSTTNDSISFKYDWVEKISREARETNRLPLMTVSFVTGDGNARRDGDLVVIRLKDFENLVGELKP